MTDVAVVAPKGEHYTIYVAGDFQGWDPGGTPMERLDERTWAIKLSFQDRESLEYKYTRGTWDAVEKDEACGEIANRTVTTEHGREGVHEVVDIVEKWRDVDDCP